MTDRNPAPSWPMDATTLPQPGIGLALAATTVLAVGFCGATAMLIGHVQQLGGFVQAWNNDRGPLVGAGAFCLGAALALTAFGAAVTTALRNGPVWHAAASVLPDIPSEPVDSPEYPFSTAATAQYVLKPAERGWWFGLKSKHLHGLRWFGIPWLTLITSIGLLMVWLYADGTPAMKILFTGWGILAWGLTCVVLWYVPKMIKPLPFAAIDQSSGVCQLGPEPVTSIPLAQIVAVQLCACRRKRQDSISYGIEVNLVWRPQQKDDAVEIQKYQRRTLMFIIGPAVCGNARLAGQLAEKLGVPLVCHATAEHWCVERAAAKLRAKPPGAKVNKRTPKQTNDVIKSSGGRQNR